MLNAPFKTLDDEYSVVQNKTIHSTSEVGKIFTTGYFKDKSYYRPLTNFTYWLEYRCYRLNSFFYNLDNVVLHAVNALLVFFLVSMITDGVVGFWVAIIFGIHPIQWESVANISGRAILLSTFFSLITLIGAWIAIHRNRAMWLAISLLAFMAALLAKESGGAMIVLVGGLLWLAGRLKRQWMMLIGYGVVIAAYLLTRNILGINEVFQTNDINVWVLGIISFAYGLIDLLRLYIWPSDLHFDRSSPFLLTFSDPRVLIALLVWFAASVFVITRWQRVNREGKFWLLLIALSLLPVSQVVASIGVHPGKLSIAEHFLYFTTIGIAWWMVTIIRRVAKRSSRQQRIFIAVLIGAGLMTCVMTTVEQNFYANNEYAMIKRSLTIDPDNARLQYSMGLIYVLANRFSEAENHLAKALLLDPNNARYQISLGKSLCDQGKIDSCLSVYHAVKNPGQFKELLDLNKAAALRLKNAEVHP